MYLEDWAKRWAAVTASSRFAISMGTLLHPGNIKSLSNCRTVFCTAPPTHTSTLLTTTKTGTLSASARPKCSRVVPAVKSKQAVFFSILVQVSRFGLMSNCTTKMRMMVIEQAHMLARTEINALIPETLGEIAHTHRHLCWHPLPAWQNQGSSWLSQRWWSLNTYDGRRGQ